MDTSRLSATHVLAEMHRGRITAEEYVTSCLQRIELRDRVGFCRRSGWDEAGRSMRERLEQAAHELARKGAHVTESGLGAEFDQALDDHGVIMEFEAARALEFEYGNHRDELSSLLVQSIEAGWRHSRARYEAAMARAVEYRTLLARRFREHDFLLTGSAPSEAPEGLASTGSSIFHRLWTLLGAPCVSVPAYSGPRGLPIGVQVVGPYGADTRTLLWAHWVERALS